MPTSLSRLLAAAAATALAAAGLLAAAPAASATPVSLSDLLADLPTAAQTRTPAYEQAAFVHWIDADGDGCDTRGEVLITESTTPPARATGCSITGTWASYYDETVTTEASSLDVDHLVPLAEAWRSGASTWNLAQRKAFANDLDFAPPLVAVSTSTNRSKADQDPSSWLPPAAGSRCRYTSEWVQVKYRWHLAVDPVERDALTTLAAGCGDPAVDTPARADVPDPFTQPPPGTDQNLSEATGSSMSAGQVLRGGAWLLSPDRTHGLTFQADGNLVAYGPGYRVLWSSHTAGNRGARFVPQEDGNAVVYDRNSQVLWHAGTYGNPGARLAVQDDGNVVLYSAGGSPAWYSAHDTGQVATSASRGTQLAPVAPQPPRPAPGPGPRPPAPPAPPPTQPPGDVYYASCDAVRAAGKAPLHRGQPGYRAGLDRDGDGIACE